jgi:replication factor C subunit 3/5
MESAHDEKLWMDKYQPKRIEELDYNHNITEILKTISQKEDFPHLIFYGSEGAGKKTRIRALLSLLYGSGVHKVTSEIRELKVNSTVVEYLITSSNYHIELTPSDAELHDRMIIQKVIKETASTGQLDIKNQKNFKIIVLQEIDNLTKEAQAALRRTMEKYMKSCRLIMSCNSLTKIIPPIRSRCLSIRVPCPTENEIKTILTSIRLNEQLNVNDKQIEMIIQSCERNVRRAVNCLQLSKINIILIASLETYSKEIFVPEYVEAIKGIAAGIIKEQSPSKLKSLRESVLKLLINGVPCDIIIINIVKEICSQSKNEAIKREIIYWASFYDNRAQNGTKSLFHLEAMFARFMLVIADSNN